MASSCSLSASLFLNCDKITWLQTQCPPPQRPGRHCSRWWWSCTYITSYKSPFAKYTDISTGHQAVGFALRVGSDADPRSRVHHVEVRVLELERLVQEVHVVLEGRAAPGSHQVVHAQHVRGLQDQVVELVRPVYECVEVELELVHLVLEFPHLCVIVEFVFDLVGQGDLGWVLLLAQLSEYKHGSTKRRRIIPHTQMMIRLFNGLYQEIQYGCYHLRPNQKSHIGIQLAAKYPLHNFLLPHILIPEDLLCVVIGNKCAIHRPYLQLEGVS